MRQYQSALVIVEKLFRLIGQIGKSFFVGMKINSLILDETLSWKICLLLAELDLCTFQVKYFLMNFRNIKLNSSRKMH
jgi:hypothetical protein